VLCYPVVSYTQEVHQGSVDNLLGDAPSPDLLAEMSAELRVTAATPPAFLWHTADDAAVPASHSFRYTAALLSAGVPAELHVFPKGRHGLGLADEEPGADQWPTLCAGWLDRAGWTAALSRAS
jgi:acetyl esterase/lipase